MKQFKIQEVISIICSIIGLILSSYGLLMSLQSIGTDGWGQLGVIFIIPSTIALTVIVFDFLITVGKIKGGFIYYCINSIIKICIIGCIIPSIISDYKYEMKYGVSNLDFELILIVALTIITIPSILNMAKLIKSKNK